MAEEIDAQSTSRQTVLSKAAHDPSHHRTIALLLLSSLFLFASLLWFFYWLLWDRFEIYTDDAYVNGNVVQLMPQVPGTVIEINTDDTQLVIQGQPIIKLDPADMNIALQHAQSMLAQTVRQVRQYFENAQRAQSTLVLRSADLLKAQLDLKRRLKLIGKSAVSREEFQHYKTAVASAQARYDYALHNWRSAQALVENSHLYTHPLVERAKANFKAAYLNAQRTTILAPTTGYIAKRNVQVGQQVKLDTPMLAIVPLREIWVDANYKESQLKSLRIGQPVKLHADAYPGMTYHGKVYGLNAGTGSVFSLLPPQNATGNWIKIVQRLSVRISLDPVELKNYPLQLGLSMRVTTDIRNSGGQRLAQEAARKPLYVTTVYAQQLSQANAWIEHIMQENAPDMYLSRMPLNG